MGGLADVFTNSTPRILTNRRAFIDDQTFTLLMFINPVIITCAISIIGILANLANIFIFMKLGFKETVNISLALLAVCDFTSLLCLLWMALSFNPSFSAFFSDTDELQYYEDSVVGVVRSYFTTIGGCITCLIAFERCLCVWRPLEVKLILTKKRLKIILPSISIICVIPYVLVFYTTGLALVSSKMRNTSAIEENYVLFQLDQISYALTSALSLSTYMMVTALTALIVWKLTSQSQWRSRQTAADGSQEPPDGKGGLSKKDRRATMTVTVIAAMYITCFFLGTVLYLVMTFSIEFNKGMRYTNLYDFLWYVAYVLEGICASANIFVYLKTSTRFKETFCSLFYSPRDTKRSQSVD